MKHSTVKSPLPKFQSSLSGILMYELVPAAKKLPDPVIGLFIFELGA